MFEFPFSQYRLYKKECDRSPFFKLEKKKEKQENWVSKEKEYSANNRPYMGFKFAYLSPRWTDRIQT